MWRMQGSGFERADHTSVMSLWERIRGRHTYNEIVVDLLTSVCFHGVEFRPPGSLGSLPNLYLFGSLFTSSSSLTLHLLLVSRGAFLSPASCLTHPYAADELKCADVSSTSFRLSVSAAFPSVVSHLLPCRWTDGYIYLLYVWKYTICNFSAIVWRFCPTLTMLIGNQSCIYLFTIALFWNSGDSVPMCLVIHPCINTSMNSFSLSSSQHQGVFPSAR